MSCVFFFFSDKCLGRNFHYENMPKQYTEFFSAVKIENFIRCFVFLFFFSFFFFIIFLFFIYLLKH